jgi:hypothetical protein
MRIPLKRDAPMNRDAQMDHDVPTDKRACISSMRW